MKKRLNILIVEDSEDDTLLLMRHLGRGGYEVSYERVSNAVEMESALGREKWDIIISDYSVPGFNGLAALRLVKDKEVDVPFLIVSGTIGEDIAVEAMKLGAHDYLMKNNLARLVP